MIADIRKGLPTRFLRLAMLNLIACLSFWWLVADDTRRWQVVTLLVFVLLVVDVLALRRILRERGYTSYSLPAIYFCGVIYGIWWAAYEFIWWKLVLLMIPILLLINSVWRLRKIASRRNEIIHDDEDKDHIK